MGDADKQLLAHTGLSPVSHGCCSGDFRMFVRCCFKQTKTIMIIDGSELGPNIVLFLDGVKHFGHVFSNFHCVYCIIFELYIPSARYLEKWKIGCPVWSWLAVDGGAERRDGC